MKSFIKTRRMVASQVCFGAVFVVVSLFSTQTGNTQQTKEPPRMLLDFRCPDYALVPGQSMTLRADIFATKEVLGHDQARLISYCWEVTGGKITVGQGTPQVTIEANELPSTSVGFVDVKIKFGGVPPDFERERSCRLKVDPKCTPPILRDQYDDISLTDEQQRLDRLGSYLMAEGSASDVYLVAYAARSSCFWEARQRTDRAKRYLVNRHKIEASRVITVDGGFRETLSVDIFISARDSCGPFPTPTLPSTSAHVYGSCGDKYSQ